MSVVAVEYCEVVGVVNNRTLGVQPHLAEPYRQDHHPSGSAKQSIRIFLKPQDLMLFVLPGLHATR